MSRRYSTTTLLIAAKRLTQKWNISILLKIVIGLRNFQYPKIKSGVAL